MDGFLTRTQQLIGEDGIKRLQSAHVAVFGLGGVGGHCADALARCGVGELTLIDKDVVEESNCNRQLVARRSTIGMAKTEVMANLIADVNPDCRLHPIEAFYLPDNADEIFPSDCDYIADAIDNVTAKVDLIVRAKKEGIPVISAMGAGNRFDPSAFAVTDLSRTKNCGLARIMRKKLREQGITSLKVVASEEPPVSQGRTPGSLAFCPAVAGLIMAGEIIKDLLRGMETDEKYL